MCCHVPQLDEVGMTRVTTSVSELGSVPHRPYGRAGSLTFSGSDQAREGRLVDALAVRGDERRDTLR